MSVCHPYLQTTTHKKSDANQMTTASWCSHLLVVAAASGIVIFVTTTTITYVSSFVVIGQIYTFEIANDQTY